MLISKKKYEELLLELENSKEDAQYWKASFEEMYDKYLNCLVDKFNNNCKKKTQGVSYERSK